MKTVKENWVPLADTPLAQTAGLRSAGHTYSRAGFPKRKMWVGERKQSLIHIPIEASYLSPDEVTQLARASKKTASGHQQLIQTIEKLTKLVDSLKDENRQLRQHIANQANGLSDRAKTALAAARQRLDLLID